MAPPAGRVVRRRDRRPRQPDQAPDAPGFTQRDAVRSALGDLDVPVVLDVDCGHVPPHLALVNGARAELTVGSEDTLGQTLT